MERTFRHQPPFWLRFQPKEFRLGCNLKANSQPHVFVQLRLRRGEIFLCLLPCGRVRFQLEKFSLPHLYLLRHLNSH